MSSWIAVFELVKPSENVKSHSGWYQVGGKNREDAAKIAKEKGIHRGITSPNYSINVVSQEDDD